MNIARDSLDTISKHVVAACKGNALQALGIQGADVVNLWPTEVAVLEIRKDLLDLVFEQSDGTLLHLEFQSTKERTLHRFALYDIHLHQLAGRTIRTVVLYANGVQSAPDTLDIGSASYHVENVYLAERDGNAVLDRVEAHLDKSCFPYIFPSSHLFVKPFHFFNGQSCHLRHQRIVHALRQHRSRHG